MRAETLSPAEAKPADAARTAARDVAATMNRLLKARPDLRAGHARARAVVRAFRRPAFYEIETRCNLKCEGCYYFEGGSTHHLSPKADEGAWSRFFAAEAARGVSMAYFVGAEPALAPKRIMAAAPYFPWGNIGTNGTIRIPKDAPFRIGVSVWAGDDAEDRTLRGASVFRKALRNYAGDPRAIMLFTVSRWSMHQIDAVARMCADNGVPLTFNLYSPTRSYLQKLAAGQPRDDRFFRVSSGADTPMLEAEDLRRIHGALGEAMDRHPDTVIYSHAYNDLMCRPGPRYDIDPATGIARDCHSRMRDPMRYHTADLQRAEVKCGTPDVDCSQCRMYSGGWSSRFAPRMDDVASAEAFAAWTGMIETLGRIFLFDRAGQAGA